MPTLYSMPSSGNSYKVRLLVGRLGLPLDHVSVEHGSAMTATDAFRAKSPMGKVPLLELDDGRCLTESNAILIYLGEGSDLVPADRFARAKAHQWMFFEQNYHETSVAVRAAILTYEDRAHLRTPEVLGPLLESGHRALAAMEGQLRETPFIAGGAISVADLCLYGYTHSAGERGGFEMDRFPAVNAWLGRVAAGPGHVPITWLPG